MIIYNVTVKLDGAIQEKWLQWLREEHIPDILATGLFFDPTVLRLLEVDDSEGPTYAIQYRARRLEDYQYYIDHFAAEMREKTYLKWGDRFIAFRSVMEIVN